MSASVDTQDGLSLRGVNNASRIFTIECVPLGARLIRRSSSCLGDSTA